MNCTTCRDHFSDYLDGAIEASLRQTFAGHVSKCATCKAELTELKAAVATVATLEPETPSAGLPDRILARIARESTSPTAVASRSDEHRGRVVLLRVALGAAAAILLALTLQLGVSLGESRSDSSVDEVARELDTLQKDVGIREARHERKRIELENRLDHLVRESQRATGANAEALRRAQRLADDLRDASTARESLSSELADVRKAAKAATASSTLKEDSLRRDLLDAKSRNSELETLLAQLPKPETKSFPDAPSIPRKAPGVPHYADIEPSTEASTVVFDPDQGSIEYSGPRDEVIALLFEHAQDDSSPDLANLALNALENLVGPMPGAVNVGTGRLEALRRHWEASSRSANDL